jgi:outer membrane lipoprotein SlyB
MKKIIILTAAVLAGCAGGSLKPTVPGSEVGRTACPVTSGTVLQVVNVTIQGQTEIAQAGGAAVGGYVGNRALKESGDVAQVLGTVAGAAVGSVAGDAAGKTFLSRGGTELLITVNGSTVSLVQETDRNQPFKVGDSVWIIGEWNNTRSHSRDRCAGGLRAIIKQ